MKNEQTNAWISTIHRATFMILELGFPHSVVSKMKFISVNEGTYKYFKLNLLT